MTSPFAAIQAILVYLGVLLLSAWLAPASGANHVWLSASLLQLILVLGIPMLVSLALRLNFRETFRLRAPQSRQLLLSAAMGLLAIPLIDEVTYLQARWFSVPDTLSPELARLLKASSIWECLLVSLSMAVVPAVCEEFFFRGFLFSRLRTDGNLWRGLLVSSVLFGFFHSSSAAVPAALAGFLLVFICHRTGSIYNSIVAHGLINGWAILLVNSNLSRYLTWTQDVQPVPWPWLAAAVAGIFFLGRKLGRGTRQNTTC